MSNPILSKVTDLVKSATNAVVLGQRMALRNRAKVYHAKQVVATERDIREAMAPIIQEQVESIVKGLERTGEKQVSKSDKLINQVFDPTEWKPVITDALLPILAIRMAEAARDQLRTMGVKGLEHLPTKFNPYHDAEGRFAPSSGAEDIGTGGVNSGGGESKPERFFHGTTQDAGKSILNEGIVINRKYVSEVYVAATEKTAIRYAVEAARKAGCSHAAVVEVDKSGFMKLEGAQVFGRSGYVWAKENVPAELVKQVKFYKVKDLEDWDHDNPIPDPIETVEKATTKVIYASFGIRLKKEEKESEKETN